MIKRLSHRLTSFGSSVLLLLAALTAGAAATAGVAAASSLHPAAPRASAVAYQDWPMFLQNAARTAATTDPVLSIANAPALGMKWSYQAGGPMATSTSIVGTTAYVGAWDGYEYAVDTTTGALIWKTYTGTTTDPACNPPSIGITSSAAVVNGVVYVGGGGPYWYALNATTGAVLWKVYTGDNSQAGAHYNWSSPLIIGNYAYIGIASNCDAPLVQGQLLKVAISGPQQGQIVATYNFVPNGQVGGGVWTSPTYDAATSTIFVSTGTLNDYTQTQSQAIVALDATTLAYKSSWQLPFEASVSDSDWGTTPTLTTDAAGDQLLSVANKNGILYTFKRGNLAAGPVWQHRIAIGGDCPTCADGTISSGVFANGTLYYAGGSNVSNGHGSTGSITAFNPGTGAVLWSRQTEGGIIGAPAYVNGMIAEVEGSTFEVLNASTGSLLYSYLLPAPVYGAVSVARGEFFVDAQNGKLYAFGPGTVTTPPADPNCPAGFTCQNIGNQTLPASESTAGGVLSVTSAGGYTGPADAGRFISKPVTGDFQASVQVLSQVPVPTTAQQPRPEAGLVVRQDTANPGSPMYSVDAYPNLLPENETRANIDIWYRTAFGATRTELTKVYPADKPIYMMIQRRGNVFSTGISTDGVNYQLVPGTTVDLDFPATTSAGLYVNAGTTANTSTAKFSNIAVGGAPTTTLTPQPTAHPCPTPWTCADIGNPSPRGDTTATSASALTLYGTGTGITLGVSDSLHYVYQTVTGDQTLSAQVITQSTNPAAAQEGIMMRANANPTSAYYAVLLNPGGSATVQWRPYGAVPSRTSHIALPSVTSGEYVRIIRWLDTSLTPAQTFFSAETSADGTNWTPVLGSTAAIDMGTGSYLSGLAATAAAPRVTPAVNYAAVTLTAASSQPPGICPSGFTCNDIGTDILPGNQVYLSPAQSNTPTGSWSIQAGGSDIWSVYDNFRFMSSAFPQDPANSPHGDGTISARVVSQGANGGPWMKTGVMIRSSATDPQAPYYGVFITPQHGVDVQWRSAEAAQTNQVLGSATATTPIWVMASRYTDTVHGNVLYSAYTSTDGKNWAYVPGSTVALTLPGPLAAGIAADSYAQATTVTSAVDNLASVPSSNPPPFICPAAWTCADIGGALPPGQDQLTTGGVWNETAGGGDIWSTADAFHFAWQTLSADGTVSAHVTAQQATDPWAKAGVMLRATTDPGSPYYAVFVTPGHGIAVQWRTAQGALTSQLVTTGTVPAYLMVGRYTRTGATPTTYYTAYTSADGKTWTAIPGSTTATSMTGALLAGIAMTSHAQGTGGSVTLDTVAVTPGELPPPGVCPSGWTCADIGGALSAGTDWLTTGGVWNETAGGGDIWSTADAFHFAWQTLSADGTVSAHVTAQQATDPWAKAGVMLRATTDPGSPYYAVFVTPGHGISVQWRTAQGGPSSQLLATGAVPAYLMVGRYTKPGTATIYYTAYTSADGKTWTAIPGSTTAISMTGALLAGIAMTSHVQGTAGSVTLDTVGVASAELPPPGV
ncbi:MAG: PQQ-binding-like beta-propeller repeat protein [Streptosporangiaceae bacterium]|nr:PQQ-binding-like beta-propeller repeat protein [Streptosporangiaceae bacterium]